MEFYPSKNNNRLNGAEFRPEGITGTAMVNPYYRVDLLPETRYTIDSGAFQERDMLFRLQPWQALDRQLRLEAKIEYGECGVPAEAILTYDMLDGVDEALTPEGRVKQRGDDITARPAIVETLRSARYYKTQEHRVRGAIAYACQGVSTEQYVSCAQEIIPLIRPGVDWFAFGGLCITGIIRGQMLPVFASTLSAVIPLLAAAGIHRAHILGVCIPEAIQAARELEKRHGVVLSTDSRAPETGGCMYGCVYVDKDGVPDGRQHKHYTKEQKWKAYHPNELAHRNVRHYAAWLSGL